MASEIVLPGALALTPSEVHGPPDIFVRRRTVPNDLSSGASRGTDWAMEGNSFLLRVPGVARFLIKDGREIAVEVEAGIDEREAVIFLVGSAFGVLLHQRGAFVLHASAVTVNDCAVLFCGPSGAGKSTLGAALACEGYSLVNDDVCHIAFDREDKPTVLPDGRMLKLWSDALDNLSLGHTKGEAVRSDMKKYYVPPPYAAQKSALPVGLIYFLRQGLSPLEKLIEKPNAVDAAELLRYNAYRLEFVKSMGLSTSYFLDAAKVWRHAGLFCLTRPLQFASIPTVIRTLEVHWRELGLMQ